MVLLSIAIVVALLITIGLPIGVAVWFNKKHHVPWRYFSYGALAYFLAQAIVITIDWLFALGWKWHFALTEQTLYVLHQISVLLTVVIGVLFRWLGMKYINEDLRTLRAAYALGLDLGV